MKETLLNEICELIVDCPHSTAYDEGKGYPLVRTPNIGRGRLIYDGMHRVCEDVYNARNARAVPQENDLIFAREATAGNVAIIQKDEKVCLGQRTVLIRPNSKLVDPNFLAYFLLAPKQQYNLLSTANGATVAHVNMPTIRNLKLELPEFSIQKRIATILSRYDSLIENYQKQIKLLEEAAQRLYKEWFVDLRFPGHEKVKVVDGVPEGWEKKKLGELVYDAGIKINKNDRCSYECYLPIDCLPKKQMTYFVSNSIEQAESSLISFSKGDIIFGAMRPYFHKVCIARHNGITRSTCFVLKEQKAEYKAYSRMLLFVEDSVNYATSISVGTTMPYVRWNDFKQMAVVVPTKIIADKFNSVVNEAIENCGILASQIRLLGESRDRMLVKLMSGEVEV